MTHMIGIICYNDMHQGKGVALKLRHVHCTGYSRSIFKIRFPHTICSLSQVVYLVLMGPIWAI